MLKSLLNDCAAQNCDYLSVKYSFLVMAIGKTMRASSEVEILLATFNGDRFLREQIESLIVQDYEYIRVLARDDGSSDRTVEILTEFATRLPDRFHILPTNGSTGGAKNNFLRLMEASTANYVCFCDQDDVWLPNKVSKTKQAMELLESQWGIDVPLLVFSDLQLADDELKILHPSFWANMKIDPDCLKSLNKLLVRSVVTGYTALINRPLLELSLRMPDEASMHDRWIALLVSSMGKYNIVRAPTVLYRQHDRNVLGTGARKKARHLLERIWSPVLIRKHVMQWRASQKQASALLSLHAAELPAEKREIVLAYLRCEASRNRFTRIATFIRYRFFYGSFLPNLLTMIHLWNTNLGEEPVGR